MTSLIRSIDGPLISTSDLDRQCQLFGGVFGLQEVARQSLDRATVAALFGVEGHSAETVLLETPGTGVGVRLVAFDPTPEIAVREGADGVDCAALKVIDFFVDDYGPGAELAERQGFPPHGRADYSVPEDGRFTEGHLEGPDGVMCALLQTHDQPWSRFVRATDGRFSEILGFSAPVEDLEPVDAFYRSLGLDVVYSYDIESASFEHLIGAGRKTQIRGRNYGLSEVDPMIGILHYGLPAGSYRSLRQRSVLPHRGIIAVRLTVSSVDRVVEICNESGWEILAAPADVQLEPEGRLGSLLVRAPHGIAHHFLELKEAAASYT